MAPPVRHEDAAAQVVELLRAAREHGVPFDQAWEATVERRPMALTSHRSQPAGVVLWPSDGDARAAAIEALRATREAWRRAYDGEPVGAAERALPALLAALGDDGERHPRDDAGDTADERRALAQRMLRRRQPSRLIAELTGLHERSITRLRADAREDAGGAPQPVGR